MKSCHLQEKWMELAIIMLSEINQIQIDKHSMFSLIYREFLKSRRGISRDWKGLEGRGGGGGSE
jgi:hypothetical protein